MEKTLNRNYKFCMKRFCRTHINKDMKKKEVKLMLDLSKLTTESRNPDTIALDEMTPLEIARTMNQEDEKV